MFSKWLVYSWLSGYIIFANTHTMEQRPPLQKDSLDQYKIEIEYCRELAEYHQAKSEYYKEVAQNKQGDLDRYLAEKWKEFCRVRKQKREECKQRSGEGSIHGKEV